jgi:murein DD-endopeptidase
MADANIISRQAEAWRSVLATAVVVIGCSVLVSGCATFSGLGEAKRETIIAAAGDTLGARYAYGKQDPAVGFDCSGLTQYVYGKAGISIPRTAKEQYAKLKHVSRCSLMQGDLVFFTTRGCGVGHVGIYIGGNKFIHAPSTGGKVRISSLCEPYWRETFYSGGRYVP